MYKPEFILENETYNILWLFEIRMDHPIHTRIPDRGLKKTKKKLVI